MKAQYSSYSSILFIYRQVRDQWSICRNGDEFGFKNTEGMNTRQFLIVEDKLILAFVPLKKSFSQCRSLVEVTSQVECKVVT